MCEKCKAMTPEQIDEVEKKMRDLAAEVKLSEEQEVAMKATIATLARWGSGFYSDVSRKNEQEKVDFALEFISVAARELVAQQENNSMEQVLQKLMGAMNPSQMN